MDDSQILIPPSFIALFVRPGRSRPDAPASEIAARYELCEDMAAMLCDHARETQWRTSLPEERVLSVIGQGLAGGEAPLPAAEARWVVLRLAELLDWPAPEAAEPEPPAADPA